MEALKIVCASDIHCHRPRSLEILLRTMVAFFTFTKESLAFSHVNFKGTIQTTLVRNTSLPVYLVGKYLMEIFGVRFWWRKFWWRFSVEHFEWKIFDGKKWWEILVEMPYLTSLNPLHLRFSSESWTPMTTLLVQTSPCGKV